MLERFDAIVVGAGVSGMYALYRLRELGISVRVFEAGSGVGGTWYWNRYPGARFDSESYSYGYSFSQDLLDEWEWSEHFSGQPETERYLNFVADKFELRRDIEFNARIVRATYDEAENCWEVLTEKGQRARARFLITASGILSAHQYPDFPGVESFEGDSYHTATWPKEPVDLSGKRVGVIGTGATAVQMITAIGPEVGHLTVFQRTPNWAVPLRNRPISPEEQRQIRQSYPEIFAKCRESFGGFLHDLDERDAFSVSPEERLAKFEELYAKGGFAFWFGNFHDIFTDMKVAEAANDFIAAKIRERVKDPEVAEKLIPKNHPFGTKRVPMESGYYEIYNQDNVLLVDIRESPIEKITPKGVATRDAEYEFDVIIYATGFHAVTGALMRMDIRGVGGQCLTEKWANGPRTYLGTQFAGFPNLLSILGPHNPASFCNMPRCIETNVDWVVDCLRYMRDKGFVRIETTLEYEDAWTQRCHESAEPLLISTMKDSWLFANHNPGNEKGNYLFFAGGVPLMREIFADVAAKDYEGFVLS